MLRVPEGMTPVGPHGVVWTGAAALLGGRHAVAPLRGLIAAPAPRLVRASADSLWRRQLRLPGTNLATSPGAHGRPPGAVVGSPPGDCRCEPFAAGEVRVQHLDEQRSEGHLVT